MKKLKKVLALALAGVLALCLLAGCSGATTDPDEVMPEDGTPEVVMAVNNAAVNKGWCSVKYSAKYSAITRKLLENYVQNGRGGTTTAYQVGYNTIKQELGNAKIVAGLTDETAPTWKPTGNPGRRGDVKYDDEKTVLGAEGGKFNLADRMGVAFYTQGGTTYQLVCLFDVN